MSELIFTSYTITGS